MEKLKDNTGASLAVALLFFVFMAVIGSVILAAASSSMGRIKREDQGNQERYVLYSTAELIVNDISNESPLKNIQGFNDTDNSLQYESEQVTETSSNKADAVWNFDGFNSNGNITSMNEVINAMALQILKEEASVLQTNWSNNRTIYYTQDPAVPDITKTYSLVLSMNANENWPKDAGDYQVNVDLTMNGHLDLMAVISLASSNTDQKYYVKVPFNSDSKIIYDLDPSKSSETYQYKYGYIDAEGNEKETDQWQTTAPQDNCWIIDTQKVMTEVRTIEYQNFDWADSSQATISTLKSNVFPEQDSQ